MIELSLAWTDVDLFRFAVVFLVEVALVVHGEVGALDLILIQFQIHDLLLIKEDLLLDFLVEGVEFVIPFLPISFLFCLFGKVAAAVGHVAAADGMGRRHPFQIRQLILPPFLFFVSQVFPNVGRQNIIAPLTF